MKGHSQQKMSTPLEQVWKQLYLDNSTWNQIYRNHILWHNCSKRICISHGTTA
jgi:hypothetical protein